MNWNECFYYDNGILRWKIRRANCVKVGDEVGFKHEREGYRFFCRDRKQYSTHRVIWEMFNGPIPNGMEIDHINHIRDDNRIENLRMVTKQSNMENKSKYKNNTSGFTGVSFDKDSGKWSVIVGSKRYGRFHDIEHAKICAMIVRAELGYHDNHGDYFK